MQNFEMLLACYLSGQMSERQWQQHTDDAEFAAWLASRSSKGE